MADGFEWDDPSVLVVPRQDAIAVYTDRDANLVIRRQGEWPDDDFVVIDRRSARKVIEAMERILTQPAGDALAVAGAPGD
jgi:hypothetical protein